MTTLLPLAKGGRRRVLAVTDSKRASVAPDARSVDELGFPKSSADAWIGMFEPADLPADSVEQVGAEVSRDLGTEEMRLVLAAAGVSRW